MSMHMLKALATGHSDVHDYLKQKSWVCATCYDQNHTGPVSRSQAGHMRTDRERASIYFCLVKCHVFFHFQATLTFFLMEWSKTETFI